MNLRFARVGDVFVQVFSADPTDEEWDALLRELATGSGRRPPSSVLVSADRGGPNARQRKRLADALKDRPTPAAILTTSKVVHGILTAIRWFDPKIETRAFDPKDFASAAAYLAIAPPDHAPVRAMVDRLRGELGLAPIFGSPDCVVPSSGVGGT